MNYHQFQLSTFYNIDFFLIFVAAMSFVVYAAVKVGGSGSQSHQQASKNENKTEPLWSEAEFRKVYSDYRRCRVVFRLAIYMLKVIRQDRPDATDSRKRLVARGKAAYSCMRELAREYNEMSALAIRSGEFPGDLPKCLNS